MRAMTRTLLVLSLAGALAACGTTMRGRDRCAAELDAAWTAMNTAKVDGFAGSVSFGKAVGLITAAKTQQTLENFDRCVDDASRASFYIQEARKGR
jgi:hypothetical protein